MKILKSKVAGMTDLQYTKRAQLIKKIAPKHANKRGSSRKGYEYEHNYKPKCLHIK